MRARPAHASRTDPGRKRRRNEDAFVVRAAAVRDRRRHGRRAGRRDRLGARGRRAQRGDANGGGEARVAELIQEANRRVHERASTDAVRRRDGHDDHGRARRGRRHASRSVTSATRAPTGCATAARAAHRRPLARRRARPPRRAVARGGRGAPAALGDHARARHRPRRRRRRVLGRSRSPATSTSSARDGLSDMVAARAIEEIMREYRDDLERAARALVAGGEPRRRRGQHHRRALRDRRAATPRRAASRTSGTRELPAMPHDEEDTLHPEDGVAPPPAARRHDGRAAAASRLRRAPTRPRERSPSRRQRRARGRARTAPARAARDRGARRRDRRARLVGARPLTTTATASSSTSASSAC